NRKLGRNVFSGHVSAALAGGASLQQVAGKKLHMGTNLLRVDMNPCLSRDCLRFRLRVASLGTDVRTAQDNGEDTAHDKLQLSHDFLTNVEFSLITMNDVSLLTAPFYRFLVIQFSMLRFLNPLLHSFAKAFLGRMVERVRLTAERSGRLVQRMEVVDSLDFVVRQVS